MALKRKSAKKSPRDLKPKYRGREYNPFADFTTTRDAKKADRRKNNKMPRRKKYKFPDPIVQDIVIDPANIPRSEMEIVREVTAVGEAALDDSDDDVRDNLPSSAPTVNFPSGADVKVALGPEDLFPGPIVQDIVIDAADVKPKGRRVPKEYEEKKKLWEAKKKAKKEKEEQTEFPGPVVEDIVIDASQIQPGPPPPPPSSTKEKKKKAILKEKQPIVYHDLTEQNPIVDLTNGELQESNLAGKVSKKKGEKPDDKEFVKILRSRYNEMEKVRIDLTEKESEARALLDELNATRDINAADEREKLRLKAAIDELNLQNSIVSLQLTQAREALDKSVGENHRIIQTGIALKERLTQYDQDVYNAMTRGNQQLTDLTAAVMQREDMMRQMEEEFRAGMAANEAKLRAKEMGLNDVEQELAAALAGQKALQQRYSQAEAGLTDMEEILNQTRSRENALKTQVDDLRKELEMKEGVIKAREGGLGQSEEQLQAAKEAELRLAAKNDELRSRLAEKEARFESITQKEKEEQAALLQRLAEAEQLTRDRERQVEEKERALQEAQRSAEEGKKEYERSVGKYQEDIGAFEETIQKLKDDKETLRQNSLKEIEAQLARQRGEIEKGAADRLAEYEKESIDLKKIASDAVRQQEMADFELAKLIFAQSAETPGGPVLPPPPAPPTMPPAPGPPSVPPPPAPFTGGTGRTTKPTQPTLTVKKFGFAKGPTGKTTKPLVMPKTKPKEKPKQFIPGVPTALDPAELDLLDLEAKLDAEAAEAAKLKPKQFIPGVPTVLDPAILELAELEAKADLELKMQKDAEVYEPVHVSGPGPIGDPFAGTRSLVDPIEMHDPENLYDGTQDTEYEKKKQREKYKSFNPLGFVDPISKTIDGFSDISQSDAPLGNKIGAGALNTVGGALGGFASAVGLAPLGNLISGAADSLSKTVLNYGQPAKKKTKTSADYVGKSAAEHMANNNQYMENYPQPRRSKKAEKDNMMESIMGQLLSSGQKMGNTGNVPSIQTGGANAETGEIHVNVNPNVSMKPKISLRKKSSTRKTTKKRNKKYLKKKGKKGKKKGGKEDKPQK